MNLAFLSFFAASRTRSSSLDTLPRPCVRHVVRWFAFPLVDSLFSIPSADGRPPLFEDFFDTTESSDFLKSCIIGVRLSAFPMRPAVPSSAGDSRISQLPRTECPCVHGVFDHARSDKRSHSCACPYYLPVRITPSAPRFACFRGSLPSPPLPLSTLRLLLCRMHPHDSGPSWVATPSM